MTVSRKFNPWRPRARYKDKQAATVKESIWLTLPREGFTQAMRSKIEQSAPVCRNYFLTAKAVGSAGEIRRKTKRRKNTI